MAIKKIFFFLLALLLLQHTIVVSQSNMEKPRTIVTTNPYGDAVTYTWRQYEEVGTYGGTVRVDQPKRPKTLVVVPETRGNHSFGLRGNGRPISNYDEIQKSYITGQIAHQPNKNLKQ